MSSPDNRGSKPTKVHPACPKKNGKPCDIPSCIHNNPPPSNSSFSTDGISFDLYVVNRVLHANSSIRFTGGWLYQRYGATVSEGTNVREIGDDGKRNVGPMMHAAQTKIRKVSGIILDRIKSQLNAELAI